jgi:hypothetical protein
MSKRMVYPFKPGDKVQLSPDGRKQFGCNRRGVVTTVFLLNSDYIEVKTRTKDTYATRFWEKRPLPAAAKEPK